MAMDEVQQFLADVEAGIPELARSYGEAIAAIEQERAEALQAADGEYSRVQQLASVVRNELFTLANSRYLGKRDAIDRAYAVTNPITPDTERPEHQ